MKVAVIGQGYVGLTIAVSAAQVGHTVFGFDLDQSVVKRLNAGKSHIEGISNTTLTELLASNDYLASDDAACLDGCDVIIIAVPTPLGSKRNPDLSYIHAAVDLIVSKVRNSALIVNESTSYPGTFTQKPKWKSRSASIAGTARYGIMTYIS